MINLSTIHESNLTAFHRNHFILAVTDLKDTSIFKDDDFTNDNHISIETCRRLFPNASEKTVASLLLTALQMKIEQGETHFLFVFNDDNKEESLDVINGLVHIFELTPTSDEQEAYFDFLKTYEKNWTHILIAEEQRLNKIGSTKQH
ncbi:hypothetical protein P4493_10200 [Bacillus thuringiensis]|uniref:Group-specific protein n=3 Tax=Bacillus thuringiensis TaxID=1428 RepID=A0AB35PCE5_BACTU|nr:MULTISPECIES: hypothetical protein [Bacillus]MEC3432529.1 hypothetical protein [Bacillus cereus]AFQ30347.1 hypothetical protein BTF1_31237 [Bacillus thuringiensis HD-789]AJH02487.1 hypothetical protein AS86_6609 [Bacillus thuringiensis HD1002]AND28537.1 hypothetical protein ATN07_33030 [Bacillus thuringiensis serovar israelensis]EEM99380.1 hypothetical protein bthur0014_58860 [Bacillus thuringiensis IBL 4222]